MATKKKTTPKDEPALMQGMEGIAGKLGLQGVAADETVQAALMGVVAAAGAHVMSRMLAPKTDVAREDGAPFAEAPVKPTDRIFDATEHEDTIVLRRSEGQSIGYLETLDRYATIEVIRRQYGPGLYTALLRGGDNLIRRRRTIRIAGTVDRVAASHRKVRDELILATSGQDPFTKGERVDFLRALGASLRERFPEAGAAADILESIDS